MDTEKLVKNIKKFCDLKGIGYTAACRDSGAGKSLISQIETRGVIPSVEKVQMLATYLGVSTSELLGEDLPTDPAGKESLQAAFWGGDKDLSQEDLDAMWTDVERFAAFLAEQKKREKQGE